MVELIERRLALHKGLDAAPIPTQRTVLQRQIDRLVYELYGVTDEEIKIVEAVSGQMRLRNGGRPVQIRIYRAPTVDGYAR